jgi:hypothetical protein
MENYEKLSEEISPGGESKGEKEGERRSREKEGNMRLEGLIEAYAL